MSLYHLSSKSLPIKHHVNKKDCKFPFWVVVPELTFGETTKLIEQLNEKFYKLWIEELFFSNHYYETSMKDHVISTSRSWISATCFIRNVCAHYGRLYASNFNASVPGFYSPTFRKLKERGKEKTHNKDLFAYMLAIKQILICHNSNVHREWNTFIEDIEEKFTKSNIIEETKIGCPKDWKKFLLIRLD
ncbi:Abi-like protein [Streptococcus sanguinis]|uniref:Abi-like protein n=5 Tax=Streptococcus sanguinis TaxID=1305 RepID=A0AB74DJF2_STRSA